jgi:hypothetical protein
MNLGRYVLIGAMAVFNLALFSPDAFAATSTSLDVIVDMSSMTFRNSEYFTFTGGSSTSVADGTTQTIPRIGSASAVSTPQYLTDVALTTSTTLLAHSSFDYPFGTEGINPGYNLPPLRPLTNFSGFALATHHVCSPSGRQFIRDRGLQF